MSVISVIRIHCHSGRGRELQQALAKPMAVTRDNPDCSRIELFSNPDDPDDWVLLVDWSSEAAHHQHVDNLNAEKILDAASAVMADVDSPHYAPTGL